MKPSEYYNMQGVNEMWGSALVFESQQKVTGLDWVFVKTIVPHNKANLRIVQQAYKIPSSTSTSLDSDVSKLYTRYSLGAKSEIVKDGTKNGWTAWNSELYVGDVKEIGKIIPDLKLGNITEIGVIKPDLKLNDWKIKSGDGHLRYYYKGDTDQRFLLHKDNKIKFTIQRIIIIINIIIILF